MRKKEILPDGQIHIRDARQDEQTIEKRING